MSPRIERKQMRRRLALALFCIAIATGKITRSAEASMLDRKPSVGTLDRYLGHYQIAPTSILTVTRDGSQLSAQISGQPVFPIVADSQTEFHWQVVAARLTFMGDVGGRAASATIHQNGADIVARRVDDATAALAQEQLSTRISGQQPEAGAESALQKTLSAFASGSPNYGDMVEPLQKAIERQKPAMDAFLLKLGPIQTVEFKGVSDTGGDKYLVTHQGGKQSQWVIQLSTDGRISALMGLPVF